ncbi:hypothetical protein ACOMHN_065857 [Nucella lapillus]
MKTALIVAMTCLMTCMVTQAELLNVLHTLHSTHAFNYLSPAEQVMLVELIAVAEACKLHAFESSIDRDALMSMIAHLPNVQEHQLEDYLQASLMEREDVRQQVPAALLVD